MAAINAAGQAGLNKRSYMFVNRTPATEKQSTTENKLSIEAIRKALHKRCSDSHNCIQEFSEADVFALRR